MLRSSADAGGLELRLVGRIDELKPNYNDTGFGRILSSFEKQ